MPANKIDVIKGVHQPDNEKPIFHIRNQFLKDLGLQWDPFITPVAEQELMTINQGDPKQFLPLVFFVTPTNRTGDKLLPVLRKERPIYVFAAPGMGKTTLRLALEATCRRVTNQTLIVSYLIREKASSNPSAEAHYTQLSQELAIDLFLQVLEQSTSAITQPDEAQITQLGGLFSLAERPLHRLAQAIIEQPIPTGMMGVAHRWYLVGRQPVRYVGKSMEIVDLVQRIWTAAKQSTTHLTGKDAWQLGIETAKLWGFQNTYVLVDGVDTHHRETDTMFALIEPLLQATADWESSHIFGKFFLPTALETAVQQFLAQLPTPLTSDPLTLSLKWDTHSLQKLLVARFRAAGSRRVGFNDLTAPDWDVDLDQLLLQTANGSPRRLLQLISTLIDKHVMHTTLFHLNGQKTKGLQHNYQPITEKEWHQALAEEQ